ncbi:hypothetical protein [Acinetobacter phage HFM1]|nr:hypothetical protein [Acinetobacter phage HFM1]
MCKNDSTFLCSFCNVIHDESKRRGKGLICKDAFNYLRLKKNTFKSFNDYVNKKNNDNPEICGPFQLKNCSYCKTSKPHNNIYFVLKSGKPTSQCRECKKNQSKDYRRKSIKTKKETKHEIAVRLGIFICNTCNNERPVELKIDSRRNICKVCCSYKTHVKLYNKLTYAEYELNYFNAAAKNCDRENQCFICRVVKSESEIKVKRKTRSICSSCYSKTNRSIKQYTQKALRCAFKKNGISDERFESIFGFTKNDFIENMIGKLKDGMTRDDLYTGSVHIDHVIPCALFDLKDKDQFKLCWSLDNLQPLWASDNLVKRDTLPCGRSIRDMSEQERSEAIIKYFYA